MTLVGRFVAKRRVPEPDSAPVESFSGVIPIHGPLRRMHLWLQTALAGDLDLDHRSRNIVL